VTVTYIIPDPPPVPWAEKLAAIPLPPAVVPEEGHTVKEKDIPALVKQAQRALWVLEGVYADVNRLSQERFTIEELAARGGVTGILRGLNLARLTEPRKIIADLRKTIGYQGRVALEWGPGGFVPEYSTVESLALQVNTCEGFAADLEQRWSGAR